MTTSKSDKLTKVLLAAAGVGVSAFLIIKYHKQIFQKFDKARNTILYDFARLQRRTFDVHIVSDVKECDNAIKTLESHCKNFNVLGFDCEWVTINNERRKVALIQLCSSEGYCVLFRVCKFLKKIPLELRMILENPEIIKVGVACNDDAKNLLQDYAIKVNGAFDIRFLALLTNHKPEGLAKISKTVLGIELDKNWRITCSDWEIENLSKQQIDYAAKDAFVAVEIFKKLYNEIRPNASHPKSILQFCDKYTDISFKNKLAQLNLDTANENTEKKLLGYNKRQKDINKILKRAYSTRSSPLYDNCYLEAPNGELLCTCDKKKAEWYVKKGLGNEISKDPFTVRLNFEPAGRSVGKTGEYYQTEKENRCVVCGKEEHLIRKNVVPHEYRKFFPNVMKDKTSHDVLLLCMHCHQLSNISDIKIRKILEEKCNAPIQERPINDDALKHYRTIQRAAKALVSDKLKIPEYRIAELKKTVQEAYPNDELTKEFLHEILSQPEPEALHKSSHGELVVESYKSNEGLIALEKMYREHFLEAMQPKFMPHLWDVNHNANRLQIRAMENRVDPEDLKVAGVDEIILKSIQLEKPSIVVSKVNNESIKTDDDCDNTSMASFYSAAAGSAKMDQTDDERYFSDSTTIASFYETIRSDNSTSDLTEFQSFRNSMEDLNDDDSNASTLGSPSFIDDFDDEDTDTEVEEENIAKKNL